PRITASHAALAVALGAFLLAVAATVHAVMVPSHAPYWRHLLALVAWPLLTGVPAFVVALVAAAGLGLWRRSTYSSRVARCGLTKRKLNAASGHFYHWRAY